METITIDGETFVQFDDFPLNQYLFVIWHDYDDSTLAVCTPDNNSYKIVDMIDFFISSTGTINFYRKGVSPAYAHIIVSIITWANSGKIGNV